MIRRYAAMKKFLGKLKTGLIENTILLLNPFLLQERPLT